MSRFKLHFWATFLTFRHLFSLDAAVSYEGTFILKGTWQIIHLFNLGFTLTMLYFQCILWILRDTKFFGVWAPFTRLNSVWHFISWSVGTSFYAFCISWPISDMKKHIQVWWKNWFYEIFVKNEHVCSSFVLCSEYVLKMLVGVGRGAFAKAMDGTSWKLDIKF